MIETLLARLQHFAGQHVHFAAAEVANEDGLLDPEPLAIARAIPKRRAEFAAGRRAARHALQAAGLPVTAIPQGDKRAPVWPDGVVGSITHDDELALACVAPVDRFTRLGIDLAEATAFPVHLRKEVLRTPAEVAQGGLDARLIFSAKEAVFKAFFPEVGTYFGFGAVEITPDLVQEKFEVCLLRTLGSAPEGTRFEGYATIQEDRLVTLLVL